MKTFYVLEFGARGGRYFDNRRISSKKEALELFRSLAFVHGADTINNNKDFWESFKKEERRKTWNNSKFFLALIKQDGTFTDGPASSRLWKKEN